MKTEIKYFFLRLYLRCITRHVMFGIQFSDGYYTTGDWMMVKPNVWVVNMGNKQFITLQDFKRYVM